jgi:hypothetical protein
MRVHVYSICWNEIRMLSFFLRHYSPFVERFVILDDGSTDGSVELLLQHPNVTIVAANRNGGSYIDQSRSFFNEAWKQSRSAADWVITCNIDEHIYHDDIEAYLRLCRQDGVTLLPACGYEMVALRFPPPHGRLCDHVRFGALSKKLSGPSGMADKVMVFDPTAVEEINFSHGRHDLNPEGRIVLPNSNELKLLHYKFLGFNYAVLRYAELKSGLSSIDIKTGRGHQYLWDRSQIRRSYESVLSLASVVVPAGFVADLRLYMAFLPYKLCLPFLQLARLLSPSHWPRIWSKLLSTNRSTS